MTGADRDRITSEDYFDIIVNFGSNPMLLEGYQNEVVQIMNDAFAIIYLPASQLNMENAGFRYSVLPNLFGLTDAVSLEASGITDLRNLPNFNLRGEGVLVAIIDTGIDYTNPTFMNADGTTKIAAIWDQTIEGGATPYNTEFGAEFNSELINQALASENPLEIVPSMDTNGHGTMMAGIIAGNDNPAESFFGVVPEAELVIVKLRQAKRLLREFFAIPEESVCFQENAIMWGMHYCIQKARDLGRPLVICLGSGTSQDAHDGLSPICVMARAFGSSPNIVIVAPMGNEGNKGRHYYGVIDPEIGYNTVEMNVGENDDGFAMQLWGYAPGIYSIDILSPSGEFIPRIPASLLVSRVITFIFEATVVYVNYEIVESQTGDQLISIRFHNVSAGIWRLNVYGRGDLPFSFHIWLPMGDFITEDTYFIQPNIYTTLLSPATANILISVTAYNPVNGNLYVNSGRGYTRTNVIKPELAAPGVNYIAPTLDQTFTKYTGTSIAAAHAAGVAAMVLEWGTILGNLPGMDSISVKNFLIRGAIRRETLTYPNREWGYGILNIYNSFNILREDFNIT